MPDLVLKPCPFCGGTAELVEFADPSEWTIECQRCSATSGFVDEIDDATEASMARAWNRRKPIGVVEGC